MIWGGADGIIIWKKYAINVVRLNHPKTTLPTQSVGNYLSRNWFLVPKRWGTAVVQQSHLSQGPFMASSQLHLYIVYTQSKGIINSKLHDMDFLGGPVVKNPLANAGDMGSIPVWEDSTCRGGNWAHVPQLLRLHSRAYVLPREKPPQWAVRALQLEISPCSLEKWRRQWHPLQYSSLENPMDGGAW